MLLCVPLQCGEHILCHKKYLWTIRTVKIYFLKKNVLDLTSCDVNNIEMKAQKFWYGNLEQMFDVLPFFLLMRNISYYSQSLGMFPKHLMESKQITCFWIKNFEIWQKMFGFDNEFYFKKRIYSIRTKVGEQKLSILKKRWFDISSPLLYR